jgi:hypothetical protein
MTSYSAGSDRVRERRATRPTFVDAARFFDSVRFFGGDADAVISSPREQSGIANERQKTFGIAGVLLRLILGFGGDRIQIVFCLG